MNYPLEKYHYYTYRRADGAMVVKAVSTYAGQNIFGKAVCHPNDKFDLEKGKELAAARCNEKVAEKNITVFFVKKGLIHIHELRNKEILSDNTKIN